MDNDMWFNVYVFHKVINTVYSKNTNYKIRKSRLACVLSCVNDFYYILTCFINLIYWSV